MIGRDLERFLGTTVRFYADSPFAENKNEIINMCRNEATCFKLIIFFAVVQNLKLQYEPT